MIGVFGSSIDSKSGIGWYTDLSVRTLQSQGYPATHVTEQEQIDPRQFDHVIYNVGGSRSDIPAMLALHKRGGPVILHENVLTQVLAENADLLPSNLEKLVRRRITTVFGADVGDLRNWVQSQRINSYFDAWLEDVVVLPSTCILVHSESLYSKLKLRYPEADVRLLPFLVDMTDIGPAEPKATQLRLGSFGGVARNKSSQLLAKTWMGWANSAGAPTQLLMVGRGAAELEGAGSDGFRAVDYLPSHGEFVRAMRTLDVGIQLRWPSLGETSGVVSQLLALGKPVVITDASVLPSWAPPELVFEVGVIEDCDAMRRVLDLCLELAAKVPAGKVQLDTRDQWTSTIAGALK